MSKLKWKDEPSRDNWDREKGRRRYYMEVSKYVKVEFIGPPWDKRSRMETGFIEIEDPDGYDDPIEPRPCVCIPFEWPTRWTVEDAKAAAEKKLKEVFPI